MKIAIIGDIHGDIEQLNHVIRDINKRKTDVILCTGDIVDTEINAQEIIAQINKNHILSVQGNHDEMTAKGSNCDEASRGYLNNLPVSFGFEIFSFHLRITHGSLMKNTDYLYEDSLLTQDYLLQAKEKSILICGHTHIPFVKEFSGAYIMNPGSVSRPKLPAHKPSYIVLQITQDGLTHEMITI